MRCPGTGLIIEIELAASAFCTRGDQKVRALPKPCSRVGLIQATRECHDDEFGHSSSMPRVAST